MIDSQLAIDVTERWIEAFIIKLNICPFAKKEMRQKAVRFQTSTASTHENALLDLYEELIFLSNQENVSTSFLIFSEGFENFYDYLDLLDTANAFLKEQKYEGIYQLASFHPHYCFANVPQDDPSNYSNRSPLPMLHILREEALEQAIARYGDTEKIPQNNIHNLSLLGLNGIRTILLQLNQE